MESDSLSDAMVAAMEQCERRLESDSSLCGLPTGFVDLDELTGGWPEARFSAVGSDPTVDRDALLTQSALRLALDNHTVAFALGARTPAEATREILMHRASIDRGALRTGEATKRDYEALLEHAGSLRQNANLHWLPLYDTGWTECRAAAGDLVGGESCDALFVDDIGALAGLTEDRGAVAARLYQLARELEIAVVGGFPLRADAHRGSSVDAIAPDVAEYATHLLHLFYTDSDRSEDGGRVAALETLKTLEGYYGTVRLTYFEGPHRFENFHPDSSEQHAPHESEAIDRETDE